MSKKYKLSIVIPLHRMHVKNFDTTYGAIKFASVPDVKYEVTVVVNGKDPKGNVSKYLGNAQEEGIRVISYENEVNCAVARNIGFGYGGGDETVLFLDADVIVPPDFFKKLIPYLSELSADSEVGGLCPLFAVNRDNETGLQKYENLEDIRMLNSYRKQKYIKMFQGFCIILKSSIFSEVGGFDESFIASEDRELTVRVIRAGYKILCMPDIELLHVNPSGIKNIIKRKRWHAIGNAQLAIKYPGEYDGSMLEWLFLLFKKPFQLSRFDIHAYIYYWGIMYLYSFYFIYFKYRFNRGWSKQDRS